MTMTRAGRSINWDGRGSGMPTMLPRAARICAPAARRGAALRGEEERAAGGAHVRPPVVLLLDPAAVRLRHGMILVGQEGEVQRELLGEGLLARGPPGADPPDDRVALGEDRL